MGKVRGNEDGGQGSPSQRIKSKCDMDKPRNILYYHAGVGGVAAVPARYDSCFG